MGGLIKWATGKAKGLWNDALGLARQAYHAWQNLVHVLSVLFGDVRGAWGDMVTAGLAIGRDLAHLARSVFVALRHIVGTVIPRAVHAALKTALHYAKVGLHNVEHLARTLVSQAIHYAATELAKVRHWAAQHIEALVRDVRNAIDKANKALKLAEGIALHPEAFAAKLAGFLFRPLVKYLDDHLEVWAVRAAKAIVPIALRAAHLIEAVIADLI